MLGCLGAWVLGCIGAWVHGCIGALVHACLSMQHAHVYIIALHRRNGHGSGEINNTKVPGYMISMRSFLLEHIAFTLPVLLSREGVRKR